MHTNLAKSSFLPWYGVRTKPNHEKVASTVLQSKGYEQYLPVYRSRRRWSDRVIEKDRPLFPGYVFCRFDANYLMPIITTPCVVSVVRLGGGLAPIPNSEIETIQAVLRSGLAPESCRFLYEGQKVRVHRGSLEGLEGILLNQKNEWRLVISITMLQRSISVEIDRQPIDIGEPVT
jgi:transcription antitermination factor NusG